MIRFAFKSLFLLGLAALVIPGLGSRDENAAEFDLWTSIAGFRATVDDVLGFCGRAPEACDASSSFGAFALGRVEEGLSVAIDNVGSALVSGGERAEGPENQLPMQAGDGASMPNWSEIDPALLRELIAFGRAAGLEPGQEVSPEILAAVRRAASLARSGASEEQDAQTQDQLETQQSKRGPRLQTIPMPRLRPSL